MRFSAFVITALPLFAAPVLPPQVRFEQGPVNSVLIGSQTAVYSAPARHARIRHILLTHARRDAIGFVPNGASIFVPAGGRDLLSTPTKFWNEMATARYHDYAQKSTKIPVRAAQNVQGLNDNDLLPVEGARVTAIATPGYAPAAVSYVIEASGRRVVCTGDLIYGEGKILDLYSLQDAVPEAKARGYHGYAARAGELIGSLRKIAALKPDVLLPAHGPMITNPEQAINRLITRLQAILQSHFETDALRWYWGDDNHRIRSRAVEQTMEFLPMAEQSRLPADIIAIGNSRLILASDGSGFLVDAGYRKTLPELQKMRAEGKLRRLDGIWITHYHDDHTDYINDVVNAFGSPVYFTKAMAEVMENPGAFRLPCLTERPVTAKDAKSDGETLRWRNWQLTFWNFPGQTLYHGGLVARRDGGQTYLFVGDSFTPSGMDDYCMQNRDFLRKGEGYEYCLRRIASLPSDTWLMNQHVEPMFRFSAQQISRMQSELAERSAVLNELSPWPDINYMLDESWARVYPYGSDAKDGAVLNLSLRILNHAASEVTYRVKWNLPEGWTTVSGEQTVTIPARQEGRVSAKFKVAGVGLHVVTADVSFKSWQLREWTEALVRVQ